jgi:hypothetical protein
LPQYEKEERELKAKLIEIAEENRPHDGTETFIIKDGLYLAGIPYLFSSDARRAFIFECETQAREEVLDHFGDTVLKGATIGKFHPEREKPYCARCDEFADHSTANCPLAIVAG